MAHLGLLSDPDKFYKEYVCTEEDHAGVKKDLHRLSGCEIQVMDHYKVDSAYVPDVAAFRVSATAAGYQPETVNVLTRVVQQMVLYKKNPLKDDMRPISMETTDFVCVVEDVIKTPDRLQEDVISVVGCYALQFPDKMGDARSFMDVNFINVMLYLHARNVLTPEVTISYMLGERVNNIVARLLGPSDKDAMSGQIVGKKYSDVLLAVQLVLQTYDMGGDPASNVKIDWMRVVFGMDRLPDISSLPFGA